MIDAGNSHFLDTERRFESMKNLGIEFVGLGISGGPEGARLGPSLMFGGTEAAWDSTRSPLTRIAARSDYGVCSYRFGVGGAGHFVKMAHNGIEYAEMQMIAECYDVMKRGLGFESDELSRAFSVFNEGVLGGFLIELTASVISSKTVDLEDVVDAAEQKGTGRWAAEAGLSLGVPVPAIAAAVDARTVSSQLAARQLLSSRHSGGRKISEKLSLVDIERALLFGKVCAYAQGANLIREGNSEYRWNINLTDVPKCWREGCILRGRLLDRWISECSEQDGYSLLDVPYFWDQLIDCLVSVRRVVYLSAQAGLPLPALMSSLAWFDGMTSERLPHALIQGQRDSFGGHGLYLREDPERLVHNDW